MNKLFTTFLFVLLSGLAWSQTKITGKILDSKSKEGVIGAAVIIKGTTSGASTDVNGAFTINTSKPYPITLVVSSIGYKKTEIEVKSASQKVEMMLESDNIFLNSIEIEDDRLTQKQKEAPLTVESMDLIAIKQTAAVSFYEGLSTMKGVDLTSASIGFKIINTRGFNSTSPVRSLQLIDGVDNQSPGLNFSLGNFLGSSELDIKKVDLIQGASSSFYGPNAFNGVIAMETKSPFEFTGLSMSAKVAERQMFEGALRYAEKFQSKKTGKDVFAFKVNLFYLRANDWHATNYDPATDSKAGRNNPGGYDAVNRYGDEALSRNYDFQTNPDDRAAFPGLGAFYRDGYNETDLVDYNTKNIKGNVALHFKTAKDIEFILSSSFGYGTTVYQGENRFSLKDILFFQNRFEVRKKDKFFFRVYATNEDAGNSYDAVVTAFLLQNNNKPQGPQGISPFSWNNDYFNYWANNIANNGSGLLYQMIPNFPVQQFGQPYNYALAESLLAANQDLILQWHKQARAFANSATQSYLPYFPAGSYEFDTAFAGITSRPLGRGGSKFYDKSALYHAHGEYKFKLATIDFTVGANFRLYTPNSRGTIFLDTADNKIYNHEFGTYLGLEKRFEKVKLNGALRMDKNVNFNFLFSPAVSVVYTPSKNHTIRFSASSAIRNPTLGDQYLNYNVGRAVLKGNLNGFDSLVTVDSFLNYLDTQNKNDLDYFNVDAVRPEKVQTLELGYRGTLFKKLYVDASYYFSFYQDFIGYKLGLTGQAQYFDFLGFPKSSISAVRVATNSKDLVTTQGASIQLSYFFAKYFTASGNYTWNVLDRRGSTDPLIPAFNTPRHKFNVGIDGRDIELKIGKMNLRNWGFGVNFKWIEGFLFEGSPQFTGSVPSYYMLDAQINYNYKKAHLTFKLGAQNITDNKVYQVYGGPQIGRMGYFSVLFDWNFKKK